MLGAAILVAPPQVVADQAPAATASLAGHVPTAGAQAPPPAAGAFRPPVGAEPDSTPEGRPIARVEIDARNIYEPVPEGRFAFVFRLANRLHMRTRARTVREQLLFRPGEPWSEALGHESVRGLRALRFLAPTRMQARREGDSVVVAVGTRDVWSTRPEFSLESAGGRRYGSLSLTELNLAGLGKSLSVSYREISEGSSRSISYFDPGLLGSRFRLHYSASKGTTSAADEVSLGLPFYAEDTPRAYGLSWYRASSIYSLYQGGSEVANVSRKIEEGELFWGLGRRRDGVIARVTASALAHDRRLGPTLTFAAAPAEFLGGEETERVRRLAVEGRLWKPRFIERTRVNGFGLVEDFDVGSSLAVKLGAAPELLGSSRSEGYVRARLDTGAETPFGFGQLSGTVSCRVPRRVEETIAQLSARWVRQGTFARTLVASAYGIAGLRTGRDFQVVVGGLNGLRAYPVQAASGTRLWRLNLEERWTVGENFWENVTVGAVLFTDAARAWGPGSAGSGWFLAAGGGLRIALPQWSLGEVLRFDLAWPVQPSRDGGRQPVLTFGSSQAF